MKKNKTLLAYCAVITLLLSGCGKEATKPILNFADQYSSSEDILPTENDTITSVNIEKTESTLESQSSRISSESELVDEPLEEFIPDIGYLNWGLSPNEVKSLLKSENGVKLNTEEDYYLVYKNVNFYGYSTTAIFVFNFGIDGIPDGLVDVSYQDIPITEYAKIYQGIVDKYGEPDEVEEKEADSYSSGGIDSTWESKVENYIIILSQNNAREYSEEDVSINFMVPSNYQVKHKCQSGDCKYVGSKILKNPNGNIEYYCSNHYQQKEKEYENQSTESKAESHSPTIGETNALKTAHDYLSVMPFSYKGLIEQLKYEGYTESESEYAADNCGADWNQQAAKCAKDYLDTMPFSRQGLKDQLIYEGFTDSQAEYGVTSVGY